MSISDEQFDQTLYNLQRMDMDVTAAAIRARDAAQREALARVEAERDDWKSQARGLERVAKDNAQTAAVSQAQLAESVIMLHRYQELVSTIDMGSTTAPMDWCSHFRNEVKRRTVELGDFLARHAQAEQQEAPAPLTCEAQKAICGNCGGSGEVHRPDGEWLGTCPCPAGQESQTAQAGDERAAFEHWASDGGLYPQAVERRGDQYKLAQTHSYWQAWQARAALATQHAVPAADASVIAMARRLLWIAYVWNDHNFDYAHLEARKEAKKHGINNLEEANAWLEAQPAVRGAEHE